jgi:hypothetical protein
MSVSLDGKLVVAISSRALFDFEEENELFEQGDDRAYMALQLQRLDLPAKPGVAFSLVQKMLAFNALDAGNNQPVEVVILSRNDPVSGLRVMKSAARRAAVALPETPARQPVSQHPFKRRARRAASRCARRAGLSAIGPRWRRLSA